MKENTTQTYAPSPEWLPPVPEWLPLPPPGKACPTSGLKRTHLLTLHRRHPEIKAANIREAGSRRGRWVFHWPSLRDFLAAQAEMTRRELDAAAK